MRRAIFSPIILASVLLAADPWDAKDVLRPEDLAADLKTPLIIHVGFPVLYRAAHIAGSEYAGPGSKPEGLESLKKAVANQPHSRDIVLYCGCCPWEKCPNVRPAFAALHAMGFTHVKVMMVPENLKADWIDKGFPAEQRVE
jgi:hypothetical protein